MARLLSDGGPAFPCPRYVNTDGETISLAGKPGEDGMSLRAYMAGQALAGIFAEGATKSRDSDEIAMVCLGVADALIAALQETP